jgi:hypothetical protein
MPLAAPGARLLQHPVGLEEEHRGHGQAERPRGLEVDDELVLRGLLHGQVGGLCSFENLVNHRCDTPVRFGLIGSIGHQAAALDKISPSVYRWQPAIPGRNQEITLDAGEGRRFEKDWSFMAFLNASPGEKTT